MVVPLVAPHNHNGVLIVFAILKGVQHPSQHGIRIGDRGKVCPNSLLDSINLLQGLLVHPSPVDHAPPDPIGQILQVVFFQVGNLDLAEFIHVEILLGCVIGKVRTVESQSDKERVVMRPA